MNLATETSVDLDLQSPPRPVRFRLRSVFVPPPAELLQLLYGEQLLEGVVVGRSRNQRDGNQVVIKLDGLGALLVVPETELQLAEAAQPHAPGDGVMITRPHNAHRSTFAVVPLALALTAAAVAAGCDPAIGEIGLHPLPPPAWPAWRRRACPVRPRQPDPAEEGVLQALFDEFGLPMHKLNAAPVPSIAVPGSSLDLYVSEDGIDHYMQARMDASGSRTALPEGTVILRVVRDGAGKVAKYTVLAQREPGFNPPSDLWFAVYDTEGKLARDAMGAPVEGAITSCTTCHLSRADDGYVFGMPQ